MSKETPTKISELEFDQRNHNKHTEYGMALMNKSISKFGMHRSIVLDKNNKIIAGNATVETAGSIGIEDVQVIESDGKRIIAVKRMDIDIDSPEGRELALADNATAKANIEWDNEVIKAIEQDFNIDVTDWGVDELSFTDKNREIDTEGFSSEMTIKLTYSESEYNQVREALSKISSTPEQAVWKLLNL